MWDAVFKWGRDSSGTGKKSVSSNLSAVCQTLIRVTLFSPGGWCFSGRKHLCSRCIAPRSGYYCKDTKKEVLSKDTWILVHPERRHKISWNSFNRKACLQPHWLVLWSFQRISVSEYSPNLADALSTFCSDTAQKVAQKATVPLFARG